MSQTTVQRHERSAFYHLPVCCPFCGQLVVNADNENPVVEPCSHTLYIAHDFAFEYVSPRAEKALTDLSYSVTRDGDFVDVDTANEDDDFPGIDAVTDSIIFPDALKVASYVGPPDGSGSYVGFAPNRGE
jgi:hypothetical protein